MRYICKRLAIPRSYVITLPYKLEKELGWKYTDYLLFQKIEDHLCKVRAYKRIEDALEVTKKEAFYYGYTISKCFNFPTRVQFIIPSELLKKLNWTYPKYVTVAKILPNSLFIEEHLDNGNK